VDDPSTMARELRAKLEAWKREASFSHAVNLGVVPMNWALEFDV
jgi:hypothetical protein